MSPVGAAGALQWISAEGKVKYCDGSTWIDTTGPAMGSCTGNTAGTILYTSGDLQYCNGTTWFSMKGESLGSCSGTSAGTIDFDAGTSRMRFCDGTNWYHTQGVQIGTFSIAGVQSDNGSDTVSDANLNLDVKPRILWSSAANASSYDVTIYALDGTTVVCPTINTTAAAYSFASCSLTVNTSYRAKVVANAGTSSLPAANNFFEFYVNRAPTPANDGPFLAMHSEGMMSINVLTNDTDPDGHPLTISSVSVGSRGVSGFSGGQVTFDPTTNANGVETISYTVSDGKGGSTTGSVTFYVMTAHTWTGNAGTNDWNAPGNWCGSLNGSRTSCLGAASIPGPSDRAVIDGTCTSGFCAPETDINVTVMGIKLDANSLTQLPGNTITVTGTSTNGSWVQNGGIFTGSEAAITLSRIYLNAGTYTSTSGVLKIGYDLGGYGSVVDGITLGSTALFNHNNGKVHYSGLSQGNCSQQTSGTANLSADLNLYDFDLEARHITACGESFDIGRFNVGGIGRLIVNNKFNHIDGAITNGTIYATGNVEFFCSSTGINSSCAQDYLIGVNTSPDIGVLEFIGTNNQTYKADPGARAPHLRVNKDFGSLIQASATDLTLRRIFIDKGSFTAPSGILTIGEQSTSASNVFTLAATNASFAHNFGTTRFVGFASASSSSMRPSTIVTNGANLDFWNLEVKVEDTNSTGGSGQAFLSLNGDSIQVRNELKVFDGGFHRGVVKVYGDTYFYCDSPTSPVLCASGSLSTFYLEYVGSATQTIYADPGADPVDYQPSFTKTNSTDIVRLATNVTKFGEAGQRVRMNNGTLDLNGFNLQIDGDFTLYSGGNVNCNGGTLTVNGVLSGTPNCP